MYCANWLVTLIQGINIRVPTVHSTNVQVNCLKHKRYNSSLPTTKARAYNCNLSLTFRPYALCQTPKKKCDYACTRVAQKMSMKLS